MKHGKFVISLDFELMWGVRDQKNKEIHYKNVEGVQQVIPALLKTFRNHNVKATFSTVGFLFFETKKELLENVPAIKPLYTDRNLSPYHDGFADVKEDYKRDIHHFAPDLIREIQKYPEQEIGTHTFSHYYCLEEGQTVEAFRADIKSAISIAEKYGIALTSLVFPRNQFNDEFLEVCKESGIICYRGNEHSRLYTARNRENESQLRRAMRLIDAYVNISGHNCYSDEYLTRSMPVDIPSSRFLRPFSTRLKILDGLRLSRIKKGMTHAAKKNLMYHLWWHPENFGANLNDNLIFLEKILNHFDKLNRKYGFKSCTMSELTLNLLRKS